MPNEFLPRDLVYIYANRDQFQSVAQTLGVSPVAMAGGVAMETQRIFSGGLVLPGGALGFVLNEQLDQRVLTFSNEQIAANLRPLSARRGR